MTYFARYTAPEAGFATIAGRDTGLRRIVLAAGQLGAGKGGPIHLHHGEEILRILDGSVDVTVGDERRRCGPGDVVIIPADVAHGFTNSPRPRWRWSPSWTPGRSSRSRTTAA